MKVIDINKVYMNLVKQALKDGVISDDENQMLAAANSHLKGFKELFDKAGEDGVITPEERKSLEFTRDEIISKVEQVGMEDGVMSPDEEAILKVLNELISKEIDRSVDVRKSFSAIVNI